MPKKPDNRPPHKKAPKKRRVGGRKSAQARAFDKALDRFIAHEAAKFQEWHDGILLEQIAERSCPPT